MQRIAVIDYGMGNLRSVAKAVAAASDACDVVVTANAEIIGNADRIVCPGQGAARDCMTALNKAGLGDVIKQSISTTPFLGICMGLQVLLTTSAENKGIQCLDVLPGQVEYFGVDLRDAENRRLKVPHMGWSEVSQVMRHPLWEGIPDLTRFYFAHSYYVVPDEQSMVAAVCDYGERFPAALTSDNIFACQFHPEKSADTGLTLLRNFTRWSGAQ